MEKEISIVIPVYNASLYIEKCVESLVRQTIGLEHLELIFVNDASTDNTWEILQKYEEKYEESIVLINLSENSKQGTARNVGMQYATGRYLGFCDSDDYIETDMYEIMYCRILETQADYVICQRYEHSEDGNITISGPKQDMVINMSAEEFKNTICKMYAAGGVYQCLYNKDFLQCVNIWFPEKLAYEDNYWVGIINYYANTIATIAKPLYHYILHSQSTIHQKNSLHHLDRLKIEVMKYEELKKRQLYEKYKEDIEAQFIILYFINSINIFVTRFEEIPDGIIKEMQRTVKAYFPDWKKNLILNYYMSFEQRITSNLIDYKFEEGTKEEVIKAIHYIVNECYMEHS